MTLTPSDTACLCKWYEKCHLTWESGWTLYSGWLLGSESECRKRIESRPAFDTIVHVYLANPNGGEETIDLGD